MNARTVVLPLYLAVCCGAGVAQTGTPSITIGTHVLQLGMPESAVLDQLGTDLTIKKFPVVGTPAFWVKPNLPESSWVVLKKTEHDPNPLGFVDFSAHQLVFAVRFSDIDPASAKSFFYAINIASESLEREGFTNCQLSTAKRGNSVENGSISTQEVDLDSGKKVVSLSLTLSDAPDHLPTSLTVGEWLRSK